VGFVNYLLGMIGIEIDDNIDEFKELQSRIQRMKLDAQIRVLEAAFTQAKNILENRPASSPDGGGSVSSITGPGSPSRPSGVVGGSVATLSSSARGSVVTWQSFDVDFVSCLGLLLDHYVSEEERAMLLGQSQVAKEELSGNLEADPAASAFLDDYFHPLLLNIPPRRPGSNDDWLSFLRNKTKSYLSDLDNDVQRFHFVREVLIREDQQERVARLRLQQEHRAAYNSDPNLQAADRTEDSTTLPSC